MSEYNPGDVVRIVTDPPFKNLANVATDPDTVTLTVRRRGHPPKAYVFGVDSEIVKDSAGTFHADILLAKPGTHYAQWKGTGAVAAVEELTFEVVSKFA